MSNMARPKKERFFDGVKLEDNLYTDNKGRDGYWRYKKPDGKYKYFFAETVEKANQAAAHNNQRRDSYVASAPTKKNNFGQLAFYLPAYIAWREQQSPELKSKASWRRRKYALNQFCNVITYPLGQITRTMIHDWWDTITGHMQRQRHAEFRKFFNYLMSRDLLPQLDYNPFTLADDRPRLYKKSKTKRKSQRLTRDSFWLIYIAAGKLDLIGLQIAMGISLLTSMRENDILTLKFSEHLEGDLFKRIIGKSEEQLGSIEAARLKWDLQNHTLLRQLLQKARELSLQNRRCPFIVSHMPKQKRLGKTKEHICQVTPRRLIEMFDEARKFAGFTGDDAPVFHGIRSLFDAIAADAGYDLKDISKANAHSDEKVTKGYLEGHQLPFEEVGIQFTEKEIGGSF